MASQRENLGDTPLYQQICDEITAAIRSGHLHPGDQVPSEKQLAQSYNVSRITSKQALNKLASEGLIVRHPGRGSFVTPTAQQQIEHVDQTASLSRDSAPLPYKSESGCQRQTKLIGMVMQDLSHSYGTLLFAGVEEAAASLDSYVVLRRTNGSQEAEIRALQQLSQLAAGLIVFPVNREEYNPALLQLHLAGYPIVLVDRFLPGLNIPAITSDNIGAACKLAGYLLDLGHRNIAFLSPPPQNTTSIEDRKDGLVRAYEDRRLPIDHSLWLTTLTSKLGDDRQQSTYDTDRDHIAALLQQRPEVTAFFAVEYGLAVAAAEAARQVGRRVPADISIVCFDSPATPFPAQPYFTHIRQAEVEMGRTAVRVLVEEMNGEGNCTCITLPGLLIEGESTAAPSTAYREAR